MIGVAFSVGLVAGYAFSRFWPWLSSQRRIAQLEATIADLKGRQS